MIQEIYWRIMIYYQFALEFTADDFMRYYESNGLMETLVYIFMFYAFFIYPPIRLVLTIFFGKWYKKYALKDERIYTRYRAFPTYIGGLRLMKFLRVGKKAYQELAPMPLWMDSIAFLVILTELGFFIIAGIAYYS